MVMVRFGLISNDRRLHGELQRLIRELGPEYSLEDILNPPLQAVPPPIADSDPPSEQGEKPTTTDPPAPGVNESPPDPEPFKLMFFDGALEPPHKLKKSLSEYKKEFPKTAIWIAIGPPSLIQATVASKLTHNPHIDGATDFIVTPLDRSACLQKIEYALNPDPSLVPSFLFQSKIQGQVEIGKRSLITHISETGCTIHSPLPLQPGVQGTIVSSVFGDGPDSRVEIRSIESNADFLESPLGVEKRYEVRMRFLGLKKNQLANVRKCVDEEIKVPAPTGSHKISGNPDAQRPLRTAVLSPSTALRSQLESTLEGLAKPSISAFMGLKDFEWSLRKKGQAAAKPAEDGPLSALIWRPEFIGPKRPADLVTLLYAETVKILFRPNEQFIETIHPNIRGHTLLGANEEVWARDSSPLINGLKPEDKEIFEELLHSASSEPAVRSFDFVATPSMRGRLRFEVKLALPATPTKGPTIELKLSMDESASEGHDEKSGESLSLESIIVDASLLKLDRVAKVKSIESWLETYDVKNAFGNRPPIVIANAKEADWNLSDLRGTSVKAVIFDFVDRRYHRNVFLTLSRPELWITQQIDLHSRVVNRRADHPHPFQAALVRPARFELLSEVSITIVDRAPLKVGTELLIYSDLFAKSHSGLWARVRSVKLQAEGVYENEFVFFGVTDIEQKDIRRLIAEDYAKKKAQGES